MDGGHGWERTGRLPWLPVCSMTETNLRRERGRERETGTDGDRGVEGQNKRSNFLFFFNASFQLAVASITYRR